MSAFTEFVCIAAALYLWESILWLPLRGVALRKRWFAKGWKVLDPNALIAARELGLVPLLPIAPDAGFAPCQGLPLMVTPGGTFVSEHGAGRLVIHNRLEWNDLSQKDHYFHIGPARVWISTPRCIAGLRRARARGFAVEEAVRRATRWSFSPSRAIREWTRWKRVSGPLRFYGPMLTLGTFVGLPLAYLYVGTLEALMIALWLWLLMIFTAAHLWWLGQRVFPEAKAALRMDALLSLVVPFHAMRAHDIASVHAMGTTHPAALLIATGDLENPWLSRLVRRVLFPLPGMDEDLACSSALSGHLAHAMTPHGKSLQEYDIPPDRSKDPETSRYCPRCHGMFLETVKTCPDCPAISLRAFSISPAA